MQYRVPVAVMTWAILFSLGGFAACKREKAQPPREAAKEQEAQSKQEEATKTTDARPKESGAASKAGPVPKKPAVTTKEPTSPGTQPSPATEPRGVKPLGVRVITAKNPAVLEAEQHLLARWSEVRSFSAKLSTSFEQREGDKMRFTGEGTYDYMTKDGKVFIRSKQARDVYVDANGIKAADGTELTQIFTGQRLLKIFDGDYVYEMDERHEQFGGVVVTKRLPDPRNIRFAGGEALFKTLDQADVLRLLPSETLDGKEVYVFETVTTVGRMKTLYYFDKDTGILVKSASEGENPALTSTLALSDIKLNVEFNDEHFKFTPPEGVEVQDLTQTHALPAP